MKSYKICPLPSEDFICCIERDIEYLIQKGLFFSSLIKGGVEVVVGFFSYCLLMFTFIK